MQVTIDSSDPLEHALRVLSSLYGVELAVAVSSDAAPAAQATTRPTTRRTVKRAAKKSAGPSTRRSSRSSTKRSERTDLAAVRSWARDNGYQVSDRGRVSNAVLAEYQQRAVNA